MADTTSTTPPDGNTETKPAAKPTGPRPGDLCKDAHGRIVLFVGSEGTHVDDDGTKVPVSSVVVLGDASTVYGPLAKA